MTGSDLCPKASENKLPNKSYFENIQVLLIVSSRLKAKHLRSTAAPFCLCSVSSQTRKGCAVIRTSVNMWRGLEWAGACVQRDDRLATWEGIIERGWRGRATGAKVLLKVEMNF